MKKSVLFLVLFFIGSLSNAQIGIGTNIADTISVLNSHLNKGVLIPQIDFPANSLIVYSTTAINDVAPDYSLSKTSGISIKIVDKDSFEAIFEGNFAARNKITRTNRTRTTNAIYSVLKRKFIELGSIGTANTAFQRESLSSETLYVSDHMGYVDEANERKVNTDEVSQEKKNKGTVNYKIFLSISTLLSHISGVYNALIKGSSGLFLVYLFAIKAVDYNARVLIFNNIPLESPSFRMTVMV